MYESKGTVCISADEYRNLIAQVERIETLKRILEKYDIVTNAEIFAVLGIEKKEINNETV